MALEKTPGKAVSTKGRESFEKQDYRLSLTKMWQQGLLCYLQLCMYQSYNGQWPLMASNVGRNRMSHRGHHNKMQQLKTHHFVKWNKCRYCKQWKKKRGFWWRSHKKKQTKCWCIVHHRWFRRCRGAWPYHHRSYPSRKWFFRRQLLLAFMNAAIKGRLRPMNLCGWRAPGVSDPRNITQFIIHQVYQHMLRKEKKAAAAVAKRRNKDTSELSQSTVCNYCDTMAANTSCMATISIVTPERGIFTGDDEVREGKSSWRSQIRGHVDPESHLSISCEP